MRLRRLPQSEILEELLREDEEESESELSDQGSETSDHIVAEEPRSAEESNCSDSEEYDLPLSEISICFTGGDKVTKWQKSNNNRVRRQVQNILTEDAGTRRNGVGVTTFTQAWSLFISENIIEKVVRYTNDIIQKKKAPSYNKIRACKPTDAVEIRALFGLFSTDQSAFLTPLQKARRALRLALKKTAQNLCVQNSPKRFSSITHDFEDARDDFCEEESISIDWQIPNSQSNDIQKEQDSTEKDDQENDFVINNIELQKYGNKAQDNIMSFSDDSCQQNVDSFPGQFLNMPDLDPEPSDVASGVELLAEFNIEEKNHGITSKAETETNDQQFLNCVLPSISNDHNDDVSIAEKHSANTNHYHSEWDQMFNDIMTSKCSTQECSSNLKELYTQISQTIHL
ncbi:unnamed protein product [Parnassius apollo]|uniref:(apollo) hypothetical protein n=1 Tax=Parnassius apollo TaxID=110799 RepID=A0A8S3X2C9_PARAO|nr:unnamed protein product [Parnassius apollo]